MEPRPVYDLKESEVVAQCAKALRDVDWYVRVNSKDIRGRKQESGHPDIEAWRKDHHLSVECKTLTGRLRDSQEKFWLAIVPHTGAHVHYRIARCVEDLHEFTKKGG